MDLVTVVGGIYQTALEATAWSQRLPELVAFCGGTRGILALIPRRDEPAVGVHATHELDPELLARWDREFGRSDPYYATFGRLGAGARVRGCEVLEPAGLRSMPVYQGFFGPAGIDDLLMAALSQLSRETGSFGVYRSASDGLFEPDDVKRFEALVPHLVRGSAIHRRLSRLGHAASLTEAVLALLPYAVIAVDASGRPVLCNREAENLLRAADGLSVRQDRLQAALAADAAGLSGAIASACATAAGTSAAGATLLRIRRPSLRRAYQVLVAPVPPEPAWRLFGVGLHSVRAIIVISAPDAAGGPAAETLQKLFSLPPSLARLAAAVAAGKRVSEYAEEAGVTEGTARQQLKELFARTGTSRQPELVRVLLSGVAQLRA